MFAKRTVGTNALAIAHATVECNSGRIGIAGATASRPAPAQLLCGSSDAFPPRADGRIDYRRYDVDNDSRKISRKHSLARGLMVSPRQPVSHYSHLRYKSPQMNKSEIYALSRNYHASCCSYHFPVSSHGPLDFHRDLISRYKSRSRSAIHFDRDDRE